MISAASKLRDIAEGLFLESLADCSIERAFARMVKSDPGKTLTLGDNIVDLTPIKRILVIAVGKAASPMLEALLPHLQGIPGCELSGVLVTSEKPDHVPEGFQFFAGGHPLPNRDSVEGARVALSMVQSLKANSSPANALCLFLLSGGGSAMFELPLDPTISLEDTIGFYRELVHSGASIADINCVRKHFSAVKGGRLAMEAEGLLSYSLLVSDVPVGQLDALASGPTLPDTSTVEQCRRILADHSLPQRFPASVRQFFESPNIPETPKSHEFSARAVTLLASNDLAEIARSRAEKQGFYTIIDNTCDDWDYRQASDYLLGCLRELRSVHPRVCLISSGEVTVLLPGENAEDEQPVTSQKPGIGGRNQHFALYAATSLQPSDASTVVLSAGTDGIDGNSPAAGAVVDEKTVPRSISASGSKSSAEAALTAFDSGTFLQAAGAAIITGRTGNNLRDLRILLAEDPTVD